jgi:hypothetical protein
MNIEEMLSSAWGCCQAGIDLSDADFELYQKRIMDGITRDPAFSNKAGKTWKDERFNPAGDTIVQSIAQESWSSYQAGKLWSDERFEAHWWILVQGMNNLDRSEAKFLWPGLRRYVPQFTPETPNTYFQYDKEEREVWEHFIERVFAKIEPLFFNLQPSEFKTLAKAYDLIIYDIPDIPRSFYSALNQVLIEGNTKPWAQKIIDNYEKKDDAIGGDTYERLVV